MQVHSQIFTFSDSTRENLHKLLKQNKMKIFICDHRSFNRIYIFRARSNHFSMLSSSFRCAFESLLVGGLSKILLLAELN